MFAGESEFQSPREPITTSIEVIHYLTDDNAKKIKRYLKEGETHITDDEL